jgi:hypothetical protein
MYHALQAWKPKDPDAVGLRVGEVPQRKFWRVFVLTNAHRTGIRSQAKVHHSIAEGVERDREREC